MLLNKIFYNSKYNNLEYKEHNFILDGRQLVGVELELENHVNKISEECSGYWEAGEDQSLRNNGVEYRLKQPLFGLDLYNAFSVLQKELDNSNHTISWRCSTHLHIDMGDLNLQQLINLIYIYIVFEKLLFTNIAPERINNTAAVITDECSSTFLYLFKLLKLLDQYSNKTTLTDRDKRRLTSLFDNISKYTAFNINSLQRFGTIEFRMFNATKNITNIIDWINIILKLKLLAKNITDDNLNKWPELFSRIGYTNFIKNIFDEYSRFFPTNTDNETIMYSSIRLYQLLKVNQAPTNDCKSKRLKLVNKMKKFYK